MEITECLTCRYLLLGGGDFCSPECKEEFIDFGGIGNGK